LKAKLHERRAIWALAATVTAAHLASAAVASELLVSDRATNRILRYDYSTGAFLGVLVDGDPINNGGLVSPSAMALGHQGELLVASQFTGSVLRYDGGSGAFLGAFATGLNGAAGLLYDGLHDHLYVSTLGNFDSEIVHRYRASTGELLESFGMGTGTSGRTGLALGPDGNLYVGAFAADEFFSGQVLGFDGDSLDPLGPFASGGGLAGANTLLFQTVEGEPSRYTLDVVGLFSFSVVRYETRLDGLSGNLELEETVPLITTSLDFPSGLLPGTFGSLLVSNLGNDNPSTPGGLRPGSVGRFDAATGEFLETFLAAGGPDDLQQPTALLARHIPGDLDGDRDADFDDIDELVLGLGDAAAYEATFGLSPALRGDTDGDRDLDFDDITGFVELLQEELVEEKGAMAVPEPASGIAALSGLAAMLATVVRTRTRRPAHRQPPRQVRV
jgi:hypothetical protein